MNDDGIDILMITHDRPRYTGLSLSRLLETCDETMRVWLWHNGNHAETLEVVRSFRDHPRVHAFQHSPDNQRLRGPTNWFWSNAGGRYLSKVDDDNLLPDGWAQTLRAAHEAEPRLGVIGCWSYRPEDHAPELAEKKVVEVGGGHRIMENCWIAGTGHLFKRACLDEMGLLRDDQTFTEWCVELANRGWINGWYYPFLYMENMDDPRSPNTDLKTEADFQARRGLSDRRFGIDSLEACRKLQPKHARTLQSCSTNPKHYLGWQGRVRRLLRRVVPGQA